MAFLGQVMAFLNSLRAVLNRRADVHKGLDLILKPAVDWDKCTTRHARVKNSLLHTDSRELFTGRHARIKHTETAVSQSLRSVCCLLSLTLCLSRFKPITIFFLRCSQHTHTYASAITKTLFNKSWISSSRTTHQTANTHKHAHRHKRYLNLFFFLSGVVIAVCWEYHLQPRCLKKDTSPMAQCVCVSSEWGFAAPDTVISSSRMYFLSRWRCGGRWNGGVCAGGERRPTIQAYQTSSATIRLVTQDPRARSHTRMCARTNTKVHTDSWALFDW